MRPHNHRVLALSSSVCVLSLIAGVAAGQAPVKPAQPSADGLLHSEVSLVAKTATVTYDPALKANDAAHRGVLSATAGSPNTRVRVAQLQTTGSLRIGTLAVGKLDPAGIRYDLWLKGVNDGWELEVTDVAKPGAPEPSTVVGQVALSRQAGPVASPTFVAALVPENGNTARLVLRWGPYEATTDVQFTDPPRRFRLPETQANVTTNRRHDEEDTRANRAFMLAQRNETVFVLPKGQRVSVSFQKTLGPGERIAENGGGVRTRGLPVDGPDFARLMQTPDGEVVLFTESAVPRMRNDLPVRFGKTTLAIGNQTPGFPGSYGIWLKRLGNGWRLVFSNEPDVWGSQHDATLDAVEIDVKHSEGHAATRPFGVGIEPTAANHGRLVIVWGPHEWSTDFEISG